MEYNSNMSDSFNFQNKKGGLSIQTQAEKLGLTEKYIMRCATTQPQARMFKSLLVLRDLTTQDFFNTFFKLVMDQDDRIVSLIEESYKMKKDKTISRLTNIDKEDIYELIKEHSTGDSDGVGERDNEEEWQPKTARQRKRVNREICSRDSKDDIL